MSLGYIIAQSAFYLDLAAPYAAAGALFIAPLAPLSPHSLPPPRRRGGFAPRRGEALEDSLSELMRRTKELQVFREELERYLKTAEARIATSVRGIGVVRFNPFQGDGSGGNQSFSVALLDESANGVVFSALYARGHASTYAKPVVKGSSSFELTAEEREAIAKANKSLQITNPKTQVPKNA